MTYRQQLDLLLAALYELRTAHGVRWVDLQVLGRRLGMESPVDLLEAARFLTNQGYIRADIRFGGAVSAELAPSGTMYLQDRGAELERLLETVRPAVTGTAGELSAATAEAGSPTADRAIALHLIERLRDRLRSIQPQERVQDHLVDVEILKLELQKRDPDRNVVDAKLHRLSTLALPLGEDVRDLVELLSA